MKRRLLVLAILSATLPFIFVSCLDTSVDPPDYAQMLADRLSKVSQTQLDADKQIIKDSLDRWDIRDFQMEPRGVHYVIQTPGTGPKPLLKSYIFAKYKARILKNGRASTPFDQGDNLNIYLYNLILGWQTTLPLLPKGTKATLYIPSGLAYGPNDVKNAQGDIIIPKNSNLIFEIELVDVITQ